MKVIDSYTVPGKSGWDINDDDELCSIEENFLATLPLTVGDNIRIHNTERDTWSVMTISRTHTEDGNEEWVRMGYSARENFYDDENGETVPDSFDANIHVRPRFPGVQSITEAEANDTLYEDWYKSPLSNDIVLAQHGGIIEAGTDDMAYNCADLLESSYYVAAGWGGIDGAFDFWHITSADIDEGSWLLNYLYDGGQYERAVSFQGFSEDDIIVGGRIDLSLREKIAENIRALNTGTSVLVVGKNTNTPSEYSTFDGDSKDNIVNHITINDDNGIQIEMPYSIRQNYQKDIPRVVAKAMYNY